MQEPRNPDSLGTTRPCTACLRPRQTHDRHNRSAPVPAPAQPPRTAHHQLSTP
ncbi:hypothetical protein BGW80DRAFT_1414331 [Lactifluus volemus]|nr:hypothetical protein BGW80DRAFT_1414331 [Lactifluus volemus]